MGSSPTHIFGFDERALRAYSNGSCWYLALALQHKSGLKPIGLWADGSIRHVGVELSDGRIVDIEGIWNRESWLVDWKCELDYLDHVYVDDVTPEDEHWFLATQLFDETMLDANITDDETLDETADRILMMLDDCEVLTSEQRDNWLVSRSKPTA